MEEPSKHDKPSAIDEFCRRSPYAGLLVGVGLAFVALLFAAYLHFAQDKSDFGLFASAFGYVATMSVSWSFHSAARRHMPKKS